MRVLRQLLREFWVPLLLGATWTAFNVRDRPGDNWNARTVLNVFGPTFFFMSWLVAQWYRVRKQQRVEEGIDALHAGVRAIQSPLLPCGLFLTLRIEAQDDALKRVFGDQRGYRSYGPATTMPPPPAYLPPEGGRLMSQDGYLDYRDGVVEAAGFFRLDHPGYNVFHRSVRHTACRFEQASCSSPLSENEPLFSKGSIKLEIYLTGRPNSSKTMPDLVLTSDSNSAPVIAGAFALDNTVVVDQGFRPLAVSPPDVTGCSSTSLRGAFLRLTVDFCFFLADGLASLPKESWPQLHNFQLWLGSRRQFLTFSIDDLRGQITRENPKPFMTGDAVMPQIVFEYEISPERFAKNLLSVA